MLMCCALYGVHCIILVNLQSTWHCYMGRGVYNLTTTATKPRNIQIHISLCDTKIRYISVSYKLYIIIEDVFRLTYVVKSVQVLPVCQTLLV